MWRTRYDKSYFRHLFREKAASLRLQERYHVLLKVKQKGKLLEIGCGEGYFLELVRAQFEVDGIDISNYAVAEAQKRVHSKAIVCADIEQFNMRNSVYDVIVVFNVLEHLKKPQLIIMKLCHALKPGGIIIGSVPNNSGVVGKLATRMSNFLDRTHISTYTLYEWQKIFRRSDLEAASEFGEIPLGMNFSIYFNSSWWKFVAFNYIFVWQKG